MSKVMTVYCFKNLWIVLELINQYWVYRGSHKLSRIYHIKAREHQMTLSTNKELIESFIEDIFNKHDISATEKYFVKDLCQDY